MKFLIRIALALLVSAPLCVGAQTTEGPVRDPRNWPTVTRIIADRYELAGRVITLRVHARKAEYYNCGYRHSAGRLTAFTLLGGPLETLTGYMPRELGDILDKMLRRDPWMPLTVQIRYDPDKVSELCPGQVDILKWSQGWQYPAGSLSPGRPDPTLQPSPRELDELDQRDLWDALLDRTGVRRGKVIEPLAPGDQIQLTAGARLSSAYHCVFKGAARTHYAIRLHDGDGQFVHGYVPKTKASRQLVDYLALHRNVMMTVQARAVKQALSHYCRTQLEITGWSLPDR